MFIPQSVLALRHVVERDPESSGRMALGSILVLREDDRACAVATDGRKLARLSWSLKLLDGEPAKASPPGPGARFEILVPAWVFDTAAAIVKDTRQAVLDLHEQRDPGLLAIGGAGISFMPVEGRFPKAQDIFALRQPCAAAEIFDARHLIALLRVAKAVGGNEFSPTLSLPAPDPDEESLTSTPSWLDCELAGVRMEGAIMPVSRA